MQCDDLEFQVPHTMDTITVQLDSRVLPLESLGTGVSEVIMLAVAATLEDNRIVCIEEPEVHLHPTLQRKLIRYLIDETNNQYFISTHSASLIEGIDPESASIFHCRMVDGATYVNAVTNPAKAFDVCRELGYRASIIMQSNCIIWVEGPSDRIYIKAWLAIENPELREGVEYSIMFYGGSCLSSLAAVDDPEVDDFISLLRINRNCAIVIDSDRLKVRGQIRQTKTRVRKEVEGSDGLCWITEAKEIENYIPVADRIDAVKAVHPKSPKRHKIRDDKYAPGLIEKTDKVRVAKKLTEVPSIPDCYDLRKRIKELAAFVASHTAD